MGCKLIRGELVAFHFGSLDARTRSGVETHLLECTECLRSFLALKRELETAEAAPRPSAAARSRLRRAVAQEVARPQHRPDWWRRPLAFGFVAVATAAVLLTVVSVRTQLHHLASLSTEATAELPRPPR